MPFQQWVMAMVLWSPILVGSRPFVRRLQGAIATG